LSNIEAAGLREVRMEKRCSRRDFFREAVVAGAALGAVTFWGCGSKKTTLVQATHADVLAYMKARDRVVAKAVAGTPAGNVRAAVEALGGIGKFVRSGDVVAVKPNIGWNKPPQQAATTNPDVVAEIVRMCKEAGAKTVKVFDRPCDDPEGAYKRSGIAEAARQAGAEVSQVDWYKFHEVPIEGRSLTSWSLYEDVFTANVLINVPVAKDHNQARLTMCIKNLMGVMGGDRGRIHPGLDQNLADLNMAVRPVLNILDATRVLVRNGPTGVAYDDAVQKDIVYAGVNPVSVDAFAAYDLREDFGLKEPVLGATRAASEMGRGECDVAKLEIVEATA